MDGIKIEINKKYFEEKFNKIFDAWYVKLWRGLGEEEIKELFDELMRTFEE